MRKSIRKKYLPTNVLAVFCTKMAFVFGSGLMIQQAMPLICDASGNRTFVTAMKTVREMVLGGENLSAALTYAGAFPQFLCGNIRIGEQTGKLGAVCARLARYYEDMHETQSEIKSALFYPIMVSIMMFAVFLLALLFVLPGFEEIFDALGAQMPPITRAMIDLSRFLGRNIAAVLGVICAVCVGCVLFVKSARGAFFVGRAALAFGFVRQGVNASAAQAMWLLLDGGLTISQAMPHCLQVLPNPKVRRDMQHAAHKLAGGIPLWQALREIGYIEPLFVELVRLGEETSTLPATMEKLCAYLQDSHRRSLKRLNKMIQPIVTFALGIMLLVVVLSVILPTFEMTAIM